MFIDDSGDPGFKVEKGSTSHFVIAMVIFEDPLEAEKAAVAIKTLRRDLGMDDGVEFKFSQSSHEVRRRFLSAVAPCRFKVRALVVDKSRIRSRELRTNKRSFYAYFIKTALKNNNGEIHNAKIKIDGSGDRAFRREFLSYLRRELNDGDGTRVVENAKLIDSRENVLIQTADMVAGSILRHYAKAEAEFRDAFASKISDEWQFM